MDDRPAVSRGRRTCTPGSWLAVLRPSQALEFSCAPDTDDLTTTATPTLSAIVAGRPYGLDDGVSTPAEAVLTTFQQRGAPGLLRAIKGVFAAIVLDARDGALLCVRDPLGIYPLFYARTRAGLMVAPTVATLLQQPEVPSTVNRAAIADHLRGHWHWPEETYFAAVRRVPPGHALTVQDASIGTPARYWDPLFPGQHPQWVREDELDRFDELFEASVERLLADDGTGLYLSGGLDSVSVGAVASDRLRRRGGNGPLALSLHFPEPYNEEDVQREVAHQLGIPLVSGSLDDALTERGLVWSAVERGTVGAPLQNPWLPAYRTLAERAAQHGCRVILTGSGGDEWLTVTPVYAADLLRSGHLLRLAALWRTHARSYNVDRLTLARNMLWRFGVRPLFLRRREMVWRAVAPDRRAARRVRAMQRPFGIRPWLAPDPALRRELRERDEEFVGRPSDEDLLPLSGPREYFRECRMSLSHPLVSMEAEEVFEYSREAGVRVAHPYWDTRLVEFLHATPPELLNKGGFSKGLIRQMVHRRFPDLGFERQRKAITASFFGNSVIEQAPSVWRAMHGAEALENAGILNSAVAAQLFEKNSENGRSPGSPPNHSVTDPMWTILTVEAWLRRHT